jgi:hypothetical protein
MGGCGRSAQKWHSRTMCLTSPDSSGEIVELYPNAEENPAVSRVFFRETVIFRDHGPSPPRPGHPRPGRATPAGPSPARGQRPPNEPTGSWERGSPVQTAMATVMPSTPDG